MIVSKVVGDSLALGLPMASASWAQNGVLGEQKWAKMGSLGKDGIQMVTSSVYRGSLGR